MPFVGAIFFSLLFYHNTLKYNRKWNKYLLENTNVHICGSYNCLFATIVCSKKKQAILILLVCTSKCVNGRREEDSRLQKRTVKHLDQPIQDFLRLLCSIKVAWSLQFLGYFRTLNLKFQKARTKIEVFLALPCWLSQFS